MTTALASPSAADTGLTMRACVLREPGRLVIEIFCDYKKEKGAKKT